MESNKLFVYGTLDPSTGILNDMGVAYKILGEATIKGLKIEQGEYPSAIPPSDNLNTFIEGQLLEIINPEKAFIKLDEYEEFNQNNIPNSLYIRKLTEAKLENHEAVNCWVYWFNLTQSKNIKPLD